MTRHPAPLRPALLRMVIDGLRHTIDAYLAGTLPLHRMAWELRARLQALAELTDLRSLNRLHTHTGTIERVRDQLAATSSTIPYSAPGELPREHHTRLVAALAAFRATLDALTDTPNPTPTRSAEPSSPTSVA